mmetsp:Transcript_29046/g.96441  ORF Transcript_29046/g.96441 Transcript_29046/m.96441 type:complete len:231 (-) Transcript_29046:305-997(-)
MSPCAQCRPVAAHRAAAVLLATQCCGLPTPTGHRRPPPVACRRPSPDLAGAHSRAKRQRPSSPASARQGQPASARTARLGAADRPHSSRRHPRRRSTQPPPAVAAGSAHSLEEHDTIGRRGRTPPPPRRRWSAAGPTRCVGSFSARQRGCSQWRRQCGSRSGRAPCRRKSPPAAGLLCLRLHAQVVHTPLHVLGHSRRRQHCRNGPGWCWPHRHRHRCWPLEGLSLTSQP